jgi:amidase
MQCRVFLSTLSGWRTLRLFSSSHKPGHVAMSSSEQITDGGGAILQRLQVASVPCEPSDGLLQGLSIAVKDSYDIKGYKTGNGSPSWRTTHPVAEKTAPAVEKLLSAGGILVAKTVMDEMAYSIEGQNYHYGTPVNPTCQKRIPGGSSSGTASAVGQGLADVGLGGDTGGSVRIPASFCGLYGIRPTHGRVNISGSCPLAPSFDTGGWFARDASLLAKVGEVLLEGPSVRLPTPTRWLVGVDAFEICPNDVTGAIYEPLANNMDKIADVFSKPEETIICDDPGGLFDWAEVFRICQGYEIWCTHGEWVRMHSPTFGPGVQERFEMASKISEKEFHEMDRRRTSIASRMENMLKDSVLMIPTVSGPAPFKGLDVEEMQSFRKQTLALTCIAGLAGLPQVTMPILPGKNIEGSRPTLGLSLIGRRGSDESLLTIAQRLSSILK